MPDKDKKGADNLEDKEAILRKQLEEAEREADEAAKRFKERINRMNKQTEDLRRKLDEL
jgi:hypothetical protein